MTRSFLLQSPVRAPPICRGLAKITLLAPYRKRRRGPLPKSCNLRLGPWRLGRRQPLVLGPRRPGICTPGPGPRGHRRAAHAPGHGHGGPFNGGPRRMTAQGPLVANRQRRPYRNGGLEPQQRPSRIGTLVWTWLARRCTPRQLGRPNPAAQFAAVELPKGALTARRWVRYWCTEFPGALLSRSIAANVSGGTPLNEAS